MVPSPHLSPKSLVRIFSKKKLGIFWTNLWEGANLKVIQWCVVEMWGVNLTWGQACWRGLPGKIAGRSKLFMVPCCSCYIYGTWRSKEFGRVRKETKSFFGGEHFPIPKCSLSRKNIFLTIFDNATVMCFVHTFPMELEICCILFITWSILLCSFYNLSRECRVSERCLINWWTFFY